MWDERRHAPVGIAVRRQIGGTSVIWGGRCAPYDPVDFDNRSFVKVPPWPVAYDEVQPYFQRASHWCVCGRAVFSSKRSRLISRPKWSPDSRTGM